MAITILEQFDAFIRAMSMQELRMLEEQIAYGEIRSIVATRRAELENPQLVCPVCEQEVSERKDLVLHFGQEGLRQKARFCGHDCLEYFLTQRKEQTKSLNTLQESKE